jgi:hypothetical protein
MGVGVGASATVACTQVPAAALASQQREPVKATARARGSAHLVFPLPK